MPGTANSFRADQVGSFLRSDALKEARAAQQQGRLTLEQLREVEDREILRVLDMQRQVGIDVVSDGEFRRGGWASDFQEAVAGYVPGAPPVVLSWHSPASGAATVEAPAATPSTGIVSRVIGEKLSRRRRLTEHEAAFLTAHASGPCKMTMPAASYVTTRGYKPGVTDKVYASRADVLRDAAAIIGEELAALSAEGVPYLQLDNPHYPDYISDERRDEWRALGVDAETALSDDIAADNASLARLDRSRVTIGMHLCRGNGPLGFWHTAGGYERIAERVFGGIEVDRFLLEYDSERAGGFEPLRFMPSNKRVVLGLVTTKSPVLEPQDELLKRIDEAARYVPLENLALSPQCGFASTLVGNPLTWDDQRRKLELVVETARRVWG
ncbi:MAG: cobalamin-independent methionine synthase II family protein [Chloroflexi bacterium]|nr:cobalamin-independent methionine synthase II family protein [Chloroflexota bacterium]MBV9596803.1 cobalamin-independent methionine synthase II family protein [Chloroflexota bacterium]